MRALPPVPFRARAAGAAARARRPRSRARPALVLALLLAWAPGASAMGSKEPPTQPADGKENWQYTFDIAGKPAGKYNVYVEAKDVAGNKALSGPFNVLIDPESDLPVARILNPLPGMRVGGDLTIVGTCSDDDGVDKVEVSIDGGAFVQAEGTDLWSLYVKTADLPDGRRSLSVRGTDIHGLVGRERKVLFDLDRHKPVVETATPPAGSIVAGSIRLLGEARDANGLRSLELSLDGGKTYSKVELKRGRDPSKASFAQPVETKRLGDGARVLWFRCVDGVGSSSTTAHLLIVDNTKPTIDLARPSPTAAVHGRFTVAGAVRDAVGIKRLSYEFGGIKKGDIPLRPGDPYFAAEFDAGELKGSNAPVLLVAEDRIGNVTKLAIAPRIDREADKPVVSVASPLPGARMRPGDAVWGSVADEDGVKAVRWSIDGGAPTETPCSEGFSFALPDLVSGKHALAISGIDAKGIVGNAKTIPFLADRGPPSVAFLRLASAGGAKGAGPAARDFSQGIEVKVDGGEVLEGEFSFPNPPASAEWSVGSGSPKKLELVRADKGAKDSGSAKQVAAGTWGFRIPIDRNLPYGFAPVRVKAADSFGNEAAGAALLYATNYAVAREETGLQFEEGRASAEGRVLLGPGDPLLGLFFGGELASVRADPPSGLVEASFSGAVVTVAAAKEGTSGPTRVVARTARGHEFSAGPFVFVTDRSPPAVSIESPAQGTWARDRLEVVGSAKDSGGVEKLSYRVLPGERRGEVRIGADGRFSFALASADLSGLAGDATLEVEAVDRSGNAARAYLAFSVDAEGPRATFLCPEPGAAVWGPEDVAALVEDASGLVSVEYAEDGETFSPIDFGEGYFAHRADLAAHPRAAYRLKDRAGNVRVARPSVSPGPAPTIAPASDAVAVEPAEGEGRVELAGQAGARAISLLLPSLEEQGAPEPAPRFGARLLVSGSVALKGSAAVPAGAEGQLRAVSASLDGGGTFVALASSKDPKTAGPSLPFSLTIDPAKLKEERRIVLKLEDFAGAARFATIYLAVDTAVPAIELVYPRAPSFSIPGPAPLVVKIEDARGLAAVESAVGADRASHPAGDRGRYFVRVLDPRPLPKGSALAATVSAKDPSGNAAAVTFKAVYDQAADSPKPAIAVAEGEKYLAAGALLRASASDDDGPPSLVLSIDGAEAARSEGGSIALALPALEGGKHVATLTARDASGRSSEAKREFIALGAGPSFDRLELGDAKGRSPWTPGLAVALGPGSALTGSLNAPNGVASLAATVGGTSAAVSLGKPASPGAPTPFAVALAARPYGKTAIALEAKDAAGLGIARSLAFVAVLPPLAGEDDGEGLRFADARLAKDGEAEAVLLAPGESLVGRFNGRAIRAVSLSPPTALLSAAYDGPVVRVEAKAEGLAAPTTVQVETVDGDKFSYGPVSFKVDAEPPAIELAAPADELWVKDRVKVAGAAKDATGLAAVEYSINGGDFQALAKASAGPRGPGGAAGTTAGEYRFDHEMALDQPDGVLRLELRARDGAGRERSLTRFVYKDATPPELAQVLPVPGEKVNGLVTFIGEARDGFRLSTVAFLPAPAAAPEAVEGFGTFTASLDANRLTFPMPQESGLVALDKAGNASFLSPALSADREADLPTVEFHAPSELEVLRQDFAVSGAAYDDDGVAAVDYRLDGGEWKRLALEGMSFSLPVGLLAVGDNEHKVEVRAEDVYGVVGAVSSRSFRVSTEEPFARLVDPPSTKVLAGIVELAGSASDANSVAGMELSFDSGSSFQKPAGAAAWKFRYDTRLLADGPRALVLKPEDGYGTIGFAAALMTVDNAPPEAALDLPRDGDKVARELVVSGRVSDAVGLASARVEVLPVGKAQPVASADIGTGRIAQAKMDISKLPAGTYTVRLVARDRAGNEGLASHDVEVTGPLPSDSIEAFFPLPGATLSGAVRVSGKAEVAGGAKSVDVLVDGVSAGSAKPDPLGYFTVELPPDLVPEGTHKLVARAYAADGRVTPSPERLLTWKRLGPWITVDSLPTGAFVPERPYLKGRAGMTADPPDPADAKATAAFKKDAAKRAVVSTELSLDGGASFKPAEGRESWRFRLETQDYREGPMHIVVKARFGDGSVASTAAYLNLDKTPPAVQVLSPREGERQNEKIAVLGSARDENGIDSVGLALRKGDKKSYQVPTFIQGLYLDGHFLGATDWEAGAGLTFFDDNVKLQGLYGKAPATDSSGADQSFFGDVYGAKLIANLAYVPFNALFGPDWEFLSFAFGLGANFTYFTKTQSGSGLIVGAVFAQLEFPKLTMRNWKAFKKYSLYTEMQVWVLSSVVSGGFIPKLSFGVRLGVF